LNLRSNPDWSLLKAGPLQAPPASLTSSKHIRSPRTRSKSPPHGGPSPDFS
jgi:hypothetical protein